MPAAPNNMPVQPPQFPSPQYPPPHSGLPLQSPSHLGFPPSAHGFPPPFPPQHSGHWPQHMQMPPFSPSQGLPFSGPTMLPPGLPPMPAQMPAQMSGTTVQRQGRRYSQSPVAPTPNTLPPAPGLPARPTFEAPTFNREDMARMHSGQATTAVHSIPKKPVKKTTDELNEEMLKDLKTEFNKELAEAAAVKASSDAAELADVIQAAHDRARADPSVHVPLPAVAAPAGKKSRRPQELVYTDDSESPEEKRAKQLGYAV